MPAKKKSVWKKVKTPITELKLADDGLQKQRMCPVCSCPISVDLVVMTKGRFGGEYQARLYYECQNCGVLRRAAL